MKAGELLRRLLLRQTQKAQNVAPKKRPSVARSVHRKGKSQLQHRRFVKPNNLKPSAELEFWGEATWGEATWGEAFPGSPDKTAEAKAREISDVVFLAGLLGLLNSRKRSALSPARPPFNAEYLLYLFLGKEEREAVIGDLIEGYGKVLERFNKGRADIWFYKQVAGSVLPLLRQAILRIGALVWLGRILRRLIS
jgi:hypothetical protein